MSEDDESPGIGPLPFEEFGGDDPASDYYRLPGSNERDLWAYTRTQEVKWGFRAVPVSLPELGRAAVAPLGVLLVTEADAAHIDACAAAACARIGTTSQRLMNWEATLFVREFLKVFEEDREPWRRSRDGRVVHKGFSPGTERFFEIGRMAQVSSAIESAAVPHPQVTQYRGTNYSWFDPSRWRLAGDTRWRAQDVLVDELVTEAVSALLTQEAALRADGVEDLALVAKALTLWECEQALEGGSEGPSRSWVAALSAASSLVGGLIA